MDCNGWYRVIYLQKIAGRLFMLHGYHKLQLIVRGIEIGMKIQHQKYG